MLLNDWTALSSLLHDCNPDSSLADSLLWRWSSNGTFSVHSYYLWLEYGGMVNTEFTAIWSSKIPLKIKIFLYLLKRNKVLTKENLISKGWTGDTSCVFCGAFESTDHLFVHCPFTIQIWRWISAHNNFIFEGYTMEDIWFINACISLKNKPLVKLVRGGCSMVYLACAKSNMFSKCFNSFFAGGGF